MAASTNAGAQFSLPDIQKSLKKFYLPTFRVNIKDPRKHYLMNAIENGGYEKISGKEAVYALRKGIQGGAGAMADGANYKGASTTAKEQQIVTMKNLQVNSAIDLKTIHAGRDGGGFEDIMADEMSTMLEAAQADKSRQLFTPESGLLAVCVDPAVPAANDSTNVNWDDDDGVQIKLVNSDRFNIGMRVDVYNGATLYANEMLVIDVDDAAHEIYVKTSPYTTTKPATAAASGLDYAGYGVYNSGAKDIEIVGLEGALNEVTGLYMGVDRAINRWYRPSIKTLAADTPLNEKDLRAIYDKTDKRGSGTIDIMCSTHEAVQGYEAELMVFKRFTDNNKLGAELTGGYSHLLFDGKPILRDRDATHGVLYGIDKKRFFKPTYQEYTFDDMDGNVFKFTSGQTYTFRMYEFCNLSTDTPRSHFVIKSVSEDPADFA